MVGARHHCCGNLLGGVAMKQPKDITLANLEVLVMPNGEILCLGFTVGWVNKLGRMLTPKGEK